MQVGNMKAIVALTDAEYAFYHDKYTALKDAIWQYANDHAHEIEKAKQAYYKDKDWWDVPTFDWRFSEFHRCSGYADYSFNGSVSQQLIDALGRMPDGDEIIMLVDGGFYHFGARCSVHTDGSFSGYVNID